MKRSKKKESTRARILRLEQELAELKRSKKKRAPKKTSKKAAKKSSAKEALRRKRSRSAKKGWATRRAREAEDRRRLEEKLKRSKKREAAAKKKARIARQTLELKMKRKPVEVGPIPPPPPPRPPTTEEEIAALAKAGEVGKKPRKPREFPPVPLAQNLPDLLRRARIAAKASVRSVQESDIRYDPESGEIRSVTLDNQPMRLIVISAPLLDDQGHVVRDDRGRPVMEASYRWVTATYAAIHTPDDFIASYLASDDPDATSYDVDFEFDFGSEDA